MNYYISFDVGGTKVKHAILSEDGQILEKGDYHTNRIDSGIFVEDMIATIKNYQQSYEVSGVAISFPGFIDYKTGYVAFGGALKVMNETNIKELLENHVSLSVEIENDANCAALAEKFYGNAKDCDDFICMTIGTGIGGGIVINGQLVRGYQFKAGEFGMMNMAGSNKNYRNMHDTSSTRSLIEQYKEYKGIPNEEIVDGKVVFEEAKHNLEVQGIIDNWLGYISCGIFNLACTLNPQKILIGGGISSREDLLGNLEKELQNIPAWEDFKVPLEYCHLKNDAGLIGALYHFLLMKKNRKRIYT